MRPQRLIIIFFILFLVIVLYWPNLVWVLRPPLAVSPKSEEGRALLIENTYLKGELAKQGAISARTLKKRGYESAFVYARYPFNFKEELVLSVGGESDIKLGGAVLLRQNGSLGGENLVGILIGNVSTTQKTTSIVKTIFDYRWQSAVHIGSKSIPGLLEGGLDPKVVLVPKDVLVRPGDVIINADNRFEYGLPIGVVKRVYPSADNLFQEIELDLPYDLSSLSVVWVERQSTEE